MALGSFYLGNSGSEATLSNENRSFKQQIVKKGVKHEILDGSVKFHQLGTKYNFDMSWEYLPETNWGSLVTEFARGTTLNFIYPKTSGTSQFTVHFIEPPTYDQQVRIDGDTYYSNVAIKLEEA